MKIWDKVYKKRFWFWTVVDVFLNNEVIVKFENKNVGLRRCKIDELLKVE